MKTYQYYKYILTRVLMLQKRKLKTYRYVFQIVKNLLTTSTWDDDDFFNSKIEF